MRILFVILLRILIPSTSAEEICSNLEWTKVDHRTQGGGFIWFPGKFKSASLAKANTMAQGQALDYLVSECGIHSEIKFHEKCVEERNGQFTVFVRASLTDSQCKEAKYGSPELKKMVYSAELDRKLKQYRSYNAESMIDVRVCNRYHTEECYLRAYHEWKNHNTLLASAYAKVACLGGDILTCGFLGYLYFEMGDLFTARRYLKEACSKGDRQSCSELQHVEAEIKG